MTTALIVFAAVLVVLLAFVGMTAVSVRRQGTLAMRVFGWLLGTRLGKKLAAKAGGKLLAGDGPMSVDQLQDLLASQPELIERMAAEQGLDPEEARAAVAQFSKMGGGQRRDILDRAQAAIDGGASTPEQVAAAVGAAARPRTQSDSRAAAKRKEAARAKRKQAKRQKRR